MHNVRGGSVADMVGVDHAHAGEIVARHLFDAHGCRSIAFIGGITEADVTHGDRETVRQLLTGVESVIDDVVHVSTDLTPAGAYAAVTALLRSGDRPPDAVVAGTYGQTSATIRAILDAGLTIPTDIRVVGFDGTTNDYGKFHLTAAQQPVDAITAVALNELLHPSAARTYPPVGGIPAHRQYLRLWLDASTKL